jgi:peptidoglycan hydrolase-like protein with peptidoglycan-binding domain
MALLRNGLRGEPVRILQRRLELEVDGIFGPATEKAVRAFQQKSGLAADGIAGPDTFAQLGLYELVLLRRGMKGATVKKLQQALDIDADGIFGAGTEQAVKAFQSTHGLEVDGMAGPATLAKLDFFSEVTQTTVERAQLPRDYVDPVPPPGMKLDPSAVAASKQAVEEARQASKNKGIWSTIKGWFS